MAHHLDLEEQEQLDQFKHFWNQYGNLISWILIAVLGTIGAWNGYQYWQGRQAAQSAVMYDEVEKVIRSGDVAKAERAFNEMKDRFAGTAYTQQAALLVARMAYEAGKSDVTKATLTWLVDHAKDEGYSAIAKLRLAAVLMEAKSYDEALKQLQNVPEAFAGLAADRRGDILVQQAKTAEAKSEYQKAYKSLDEQTPLRRLVAVKLNAMGVDPDADAKPSKTGGAS